MDPDPSKTNLMVKMNPQSLKKIIYEKDKTLESAQI